MPLPIIGGIMSAAGLIGSLATLFKKSPKAPEWRDANFEHNLGLDTNADSYDAGSQKAYDQMAYMRGGYLEGMDKSLGEAQRSEEQTLRRMVADQQPTMASMRGMASIGGAGGFLSNVLAQQQIQGQQARSQDQMTGALEGIGQRFTQARIGTRQGAEQMAQGYFGMGLDARTKAVLSSKEAEARNRMFYAESTNQETQYNTSGRMGAEMGAYQGQLQQDQNKLGFFNQLMGLGGGLLTRGGDPQTAPGNPPETPGETSETMGFGSTFGQTASFASQVGPSLRFNNTSQQTSQAQQPAASSGGFIGPPAPHRVQVSYPPNQAPFSVPGWNSVGTAGNQSSGKGMWPNTGSSIYRSPQPSGVNFNSNYNVNLNDQNFWKPR